MFDISMEAIVSYLWAPVTAFAFLHVVFSPLQKYFPANKNQKFFRPNWKTDFFFFLGQHLLWVALVVWLLGYVATFLDQAIPWQFRTMVASQPFWLQVIVVVFLSDFLVYWGHRLQHRIDFLWRFHKVHHTVEHLDWVAAHREHPLDTFYTMGLINLPAVIMGFPIGSIMALFLFRGVWAIYIHSNARIPLGPLKMLIGAPQLHHWHHAKDRDFGNYANISPLMDILFGTYICPDHEPQELGLHEKMPQDYLGLLRYPFK